MISMSKLSRIAPDLVPPYQAAGVSLAKRGMVGQRYAVYLVLDRSGSMYDYYRDGTVQALADRVLALAAHLDDDGIVPVVFFGSQAWQPIPIQIGRHAGWVAAQHARLGPWGTTNYAAAMQAVIAHYQASRPTVPAFVIFQTDGEPDSRDAAQQVVCRAAQLPMFWQFIGFGPNEQFSFLRRLNQLSSPRWRVVDNAGYFTAGAAPQGMTDARLYGRLTAELPKWRAAALAAGVLRA